MLEWNKSYQFYCPRCKKPAAVHETLCRKHAAQALRTPYFLCGECRLMFISKQLVRKAVSDWWHMTGLKRTIPFNYFYDEAIQYLYGPSVLGYHQEIGYRLTRFLKRRK